MFRVNLWCGLELGSGLGLRVSMRVRLNVPFLCECS